MSTTSSSSPIYMATVSAPTNIAVIKYWGKADVNLNTPINSSVSVTLDQKDLRAVTTVAASTAFTQDRLWLNGVEEADPYNNNKRFRVCIDQVKALAAVSCTRTDTTSATDNTTAENTVLKEDWNKMKIHVSSYNTFPTAAGLASSAAGYAALVAALAQLVEAQEEFPGQLSTIARQGSGSACRSLQGGFVAWRMGTPPAWTDSKAEQIAPETHWPEMRALILVVSDLKKDTSSTAGMSTSVATSTLLAHRAASVVPQRMMDMEAAWLAKDFVSFAKLTMQDSNQFHAVCGDTYPPIFYMNDVSRSVIRIVGAYNKWAGQERVAYTFDAGPNAVLYVLDEHLTETAALVLHYFPAPAEKSMADYFNRPALTETIANSYKLDPTLLEACNATGRSPEAGHVKQVYCTQAGPGPQVLTMEDANLDPATGLNTYHA
jgi:diphosphomevalonate decarboxylase